MHLDMNFKNSAHWADAGTKRGMATILCTRRHRSSVLLDGRSAQAQHFAAPPPTACLYPRRPPLLTLTTGLDTARVLRTATVEGKQQVLRAALGIDAGCFLWDAATSFGWGALIAVSEVVFNFSTAAPLIWPRGD